MSSLTVTERNDLEADRPFGLPADSIEITLDLPFPISVNRIWRSVGKRVIRSPKYQAWIKQCDLLVLVRKQYPQRKITGEFTFELLLNEQFGGGDGDNCIKATLDWMQSRQIIKNDQHCHGGRWEWVRYDRAPFGCKVILRSWHG